jgi:sensor histidine kinase YesM
MLFGILAMLFLAISAYLLYKQRSLKQENIQTEIEQRFLRSQLNPHFIFNALLAIQNFMLKNNAQAAALYLTKFSKLMREILETSRHSYITIFDEVEMLTNYMDIHKLRLNDAFEYEINIDENIDPESDSIPPMFIQPFVENAIEHGISHMEHGGLVSLSFKKEISFISIEVLDNGGGLSQEPNATKLHRSLASTIIAERIALFNKTIRHKIALTVEEVKGENGEVLGTCARLKVPFQ